MMNIIMITILVVILSFLILLIHSKKKLVKSNSHVTNLPPGKFGLPVVGETIGFLYSSRKGNLQRFIVERMKRYSPKVFKTSLFLEKMVVICDAPGNKIVFSNENKLVRAWFPGSVGKLLFPDLDKMDTTFEQEIAKMRRIVFEFVNPGAVHKYIEMMDNTTKHHMDTEWAPNSKITVHPIAKKLAFSLACGIFMGLDYTSARIGKMEHHFEILTLGLITLPLNLPGTPYHRAIKAAEFIRAEIQSVIRSMNQSENTVNFLSRLLSATDEQGKLLSEWHVANLMMGTFIATHESTSSLFTNMVYYLSDNPEVYNLAFKEQMEIKRSKGGETLLTWEDTKRMKYGLNIVNEVLRLAPPAVGSFREVINDMSYDGFTIPKGWKMLCNFSSSHRNPKYFPDPEKFDPTRFDGNGPVPNSFIPFGGGSRMCPGNELARQAALVFLHNLLVNFKWEKLIPDEKIIVAPSPFPANGLPIKLQKLGDDDAGSH